MLALVTKMLANLAIADRESLYEDQCIVDSQERIQHMKGLQECIQDVNKSQEYIRHLIDLVLEERNQEKIPVLPLDDLVKKGIAICKLEVKEGRRDIAGLYNVVLGMEQTIIGHDVTIPPHKIAKGNVVSLSRYDPHSNRVHEGFHAVVSRVKKHEIHLILCNDLTDLPASLRDICQIVQLPCYVPYSRMLGALQNLKMKDKLKRLNSLASILLEKKSPCLPAIDRDKLVLFDTKLNKYQEEAASFALHSPEIALIHGPPGTGKTQTLVEIIRQLHKQAKTVLVTGPSNVAVDNLMERVVGRGGMEVIRVGNLARISPACIENSLDKKAPRDSPKRIVRKALILKADVVFSTLCGSGSRDLEDMEFDVVIIDEASQATEPDCWVALVKARKVILAGDHLQLPPTVLSTTDNAFVEKGMSVCNTLSYSLFDRLLDTYGDGIKRMLEIQYRMNSVIMEFSSMHLYDNKLVAHPSVQDHLLCDLDHVERNEDTTKAIIMYDTARLGDAEEQKSKQFDDNSFYNLKEVAIVVNVIYELLEYGVKKSEIGVITPYSAQVSHLQNSLGDDFEDIEIGSVDGFQGKEKEVIILSMVRSNKIGLVGFVGEKRRLNVAITRAKRQLVIVGNMTTMKGRAEKSSQSNRFLCKWVKWLTNDHEDDNKTNDNDSNESDAIVKPKVQT